MYLRLMIIIVFTTIERTKLLFFFEEYKQCSYIYFF